MPLNTFDLYIKKKVIFIPVLVSRNVINTRLADQVMNYEQAGGEKKNVKD